MSVREILSSVVLVILIAASSATDIGSDESTLIRMVPDGLREVEESFVKILGQSRQVLSFARFTHKYGKMYQNEEAIKHRFSVFKENLDYIRSTNKKGLSYKLGVNQFADMTFQEFQGSKSGSAQYSFATLKGSHPNLTAATAIPETRDWRDDGFVGRVKNQDLCEASWAFSATGAVASAVFQKYGIKRDLSEQQLIDCSYLRYGTHGCLGGLPSQAFDYIKREGLTSEQEYPYRDVRGLCKRNLPQSHVNVTGYVSIPSGAEDVLKQVVGTMGPVSISLDVNRSIMQYSGGIYLSIGCINYVKVGKQYALVVGYGTENGLPYWLIKNSWGQSWGDNGYFKLEMGKNACGVATSATYPVVA